MNADRILNIKNKSDLSVLRKYAAPFDFSEKGVLKVAGAKFTAKEINALLMRMRRAMREANGVGLAANQIGLPYQLFVAQVSNPQGEAKAYEVFNPILKKLSGGKETLEEGCLSVPRVYGEVSRAEQVVLKGLDKHGRPLKIKAWGLLARVFQHEVDHLNGILFSDKAKKLYEVVTTKPDAKTG